MFIVREYIACLFVILLGATFVSAGYGIVIAFRAACRIVAGTRRSPRKTPATDARATRFTSLWIALIVIVLPGAARAREFPASQDAQDGAYTIRMSVDHVVLHVAVRNHRGTPVAGLVKDNFQIYEDGVFQKISYFSHDDIPVEVGLIVDNSGSMRPKIREVIAAALAFARSSNPQDQMFVVNFNEHVSFGLPANQSFTGQVNQLELALSTISARGETALYDAVAAGLEHLHKGTRDKKVLLVISDGADNASRHTKAEILAMAGQSDAIIYTIGLFDEGDPDQRFGVLKQLAKAAGGEACLPESIKEVVPICEGIAHDIRSQYTLAYVPTNRKLDGTYRALRVKAGAPGRGRVSVRTRDGYYTRIPPKPDTAVHNQSREP